MGVLGRPASPMCPASVQTPSLIGSQHPCLALTLGGPGCGKVLPFNAVLKTSFLECLTTNPSGPGSLQNQSGLFRRELLKYLKAARYAICLQPLLS